MNKLLFTMLAILLMVGGAYAQNTNGDDDDDGSSQTSFPDVPEGSYAADAVAELADLGIVIGFPDGTFRGNEAFTRYQAALVVTRLIDVLEDQFVTEDELGSLRNAVQEIASDIAALEAAIGSGTGMDADALQDLQNQLDALRELEARVSQNTRSIDALNDLVALLNEEIVGLQSGGDIDPAFLDDIAQNSADIANIREFVILLRRDQVALRDQVAALTESDTQQNERLSGLEERVSTLEDQAISFTGSLGVEYDVQRLRGSDVPFDVDRIFGIGLERELTVSLFTSGTEDEDDDGNADDEGEVAEDREDIEPESGELEPTFEVSFGFASERGLRGAFNEFEASAVLELERATVIDADELESDELTMDDILDEDNYFDEAYVFSFNEIDLNFSPIGAEPLTFSFGEEPDANFTPYVFESLGVGFVARLGTPDVLAFLQPELTLAYGAFEEGGDDEDDVIELADDDFIVVDGEAQENPFSEAYYSGIRGTLSPFESVSGGFSVARITGNADDYYSDEEEDENVNITVYGLDGEVNLSIFTVTAEIATNQIDDGVNFQNEDEEEDATVGGEEQEDVPVAIPTDVEIDDSTLFYAQLEVDTSDIPLLETLEANYRNIPQYWYGLKYDVDTYVYDLDQEGFAARAGIGLFIFNLEVYGDYYTIAEAETAIEQGEDEGAAAEVTGDTVLVYGVDVGVEVYRALEPFAFYSQSLLGDSFDDLTAVEDLDDAERDDSDYFSGYGVGVRHEGDAENALVPGLNFEIAYDFSETELVGSGLNAEADTEFSYFGVTVNPYFNFESEASAGPFSDDEETLEFGTGLETEPLDVFLQPSLVANVNYRNTDHTDVDPDDIESPLFDPAVDGDNAYTATELQFSAGVALNEFFFPNSQLNVRYGYYQGENIQNQTTSNGTDDDTATDISDGDEFNDLTQTTQGLEVGWAYYGLEFSYGLYRNDRDAPVDTDDVTTTGQAFSVAYELEF